MLDLTNDPDGHEMVPTHLWGEVFGEQSGKIAILLESALKKFAVGNDFYCPDYPGDVIPATLDNVWQMRGTKAPAAVDFSRRVEVLDLMGIRRQLIFPSYALFAQLLATASEFTLSNFGVTLSEDEAHEIGRAGVQEYNDWAARTTALAPDRLRVAGYLIPNGSVADLMSDTRALVGKGIRVVNVPSSMPPAGLSPASFALDEFYGYLADNNVALTIHVGGEYGFLKDGAWGQAEAFAPGKVESHELGLEPYSISTSYFPIANYLTAMLLGGVFERHSQLRFGAIEIAAHWFGPLADNLDMFATKVYAERLKPFISMLPSEYMARNVRVTPFNNFEPIEQYLATYTHLQTSYMYSTDYPHVEGGKDIKRVFYERLLSLGDIVMEKFFITNAQWLLPD
ncbi:MAG: amidohydrolase family protein [Ilumatobacteraceae bacterium]